MEYMKRKGQRKIVSRKNGLWQLSCGHEVGPRADGSRVYQSVICDLCHARMKELNRKKSS